MFLHEDKILFERVISFTSNKLKVDSSIIVKDYYVTMFLRGISKSSPD